MQVFDYTEYRPFIRDWLGNQPKAGRGVLRSWALAFSVHPTLLSQILSGKRNLTLELAEMISDEIKLTENETNYFLLLVMYEHAGTLRLKNKFLKDINAARTKAKLISERIRTDLELSEEAKSAFYSTWFFSGIRNLTAVPGFQTAEAIALRLGLPRDVVAHAVQILVESGLCKYEGDHLTVGAQRTYLKADSPLVDRHHQNWRLHGFSKMPLKRSEDLFLTIPMSLSFADCEKIRTLLPKWFDDISKIVGPSQSQTVRCLNLDFFEY